MRWPGVARDDKQGRPPLGSILCQRCYQEQLKVRSFHEWFSKRGSTSLFQLALKVAAETFRSNELISVWVFLESNTTAHIKLLLLPQYFSSRFVIPHTSHSPIKPANVNSQSKGAVCKITQLRWDTKFHPRRTSADMQHHCQDQNGITPWVEYAFTVHPATLV